MTKNYLKLYLIIASILLAITLVTVFAVHNKVLADSQNWYKDYTYALDNQNHTITLTKYNGDDTTIRVRPTVTINNETYNVILNGRVFGSESYNETTDLISITIEPGVKTGNSCDLMFYNCRELTTLDVSGLDTSNATSMNFMFYKCEKLTSLNLSNFDTRSVTNMANMFCDCEKLTNLDVSSFSTSYVTDMSSMFCNCKSLTNLNVSRFNTSRVTNMYSMFSGCEKLREINVTYFNTRNVTDMSYMFNRCKQLTRLDFSNFNTSRISTTELSHYDNNSYFGTTYEINMRQMLSDCSNLGELTLGEDFAFKNCNSQTGNIYSLDMNEGNILGLDKSLWVDVDDIYYNYAEIPGGMEETYYRYLPMVTIIRDDYNAFRWSVNEGIEIVGYQITESEDLYDDNDLTISTQTSGIYEIDTDNPKTYYVWVKDINDNVFYGMISSYKLIKNVGTGTTLKLWDGERGEKELNTTCVLDGTKVLIQSNLKSGYNTLVIKRGNSEELPNNKIITIDSNTTISSSATKNNDLMFEDQTIDLEYDKNNQNVEITNPIYGSGKYSFIEISEKTTDGISTSYLTIRNGKIVVTAKTPATTYLMTLRAIDNVTGMVSNAVYTINIAPLSGTMSIDSNNYTIESNIIKRIQPNTKKSEFEARMQISGEYSIYNKDGRQLTDSDIIKTGNKIVFANGTEKLLVVIGDVNKDGYANLYDVLEINKYRLGITQLEEILLIAADADNNENVTIKDILEINKYRLEIIKKF